MVIANNKIDAKRFGVFDFFNGLNTAIESNNQTEIIGSCIIDSGV